MKFPMELYFFLQIILYYNANSYEIAMEILIW